MSKATMPVNDRVGYSGFKSANTHPVYASSSACFSKLVDSLPNFGGTNQFTMETILLPDFTIKRPVPIASIEYLEAKGNYTWVYIARNKPLLVAITLKQMAQRLPAFLRLHKSVLVNPSCILAYRAHLVDPPFVQISRERRLPISRRQHRQLRPRLAAYERLSPSVG